MIKTLRRLAQLWSVFALTGWCAVSVVASAPQEWKARGLAAFDAVWQTINATYYDPSFGGLDWPSIRDELRPQVERAATLDEQRDVIRTMLGRLGQSHFSLLTSAATRDAPRGPATVPFDVRVTSFGVLITRLLEDTPSGLRPGDRLHEIDGITVASLLSAVPTGDPHPGQTGWRYVTRALSGAAGSAVRLRVEAPGGEPREVSLRRTLRPGGEVTVGNLPPLRAHLEATATQTSSGLRVGVIRFNIWMANLSEPFAQAIDRFREAKGLIIDLRGNPGGLAEMIRGVAGHVVDQPVVLGQMRMRDLELEFRANPRRSTLDGRAVAPYAGPLAILVDDLTASASECFAGGLQAIGRARVFGTPTAGQALPAVTEQLVSGDVLMYAVGDFVTPAGRRLEGHGVMPDTVVSLEPEGLAAGRDAERVALEWIEAVARVPSR